MPESRIIPAIIPQSLEHLGEAIATLRGVAHEIQIDIVDGLFVPFTSWPYADETADQKDIASRISLLENIVPSGIACEFDLMIARPLETLPAWLALRPARIVLHIESVADDAETMQTIKVVHDAGSKAILASGNDMALERLLALAASVDGVQCMGIAEIGRQGNPFDTRVLDRIAAIREAYPLLSISVDGSVNTETIPLLKEAGANRFVAGSSIFNSADPASAYTQLLTLLTP